MEDYIIKVFRHFVLHVRLPFLVHSFISISVTWDISPAMLLLTLILALVECVQAQIPGLGFGPTYIFSVRNTYLTEYSTVLRVPEYPKSPRGLVVLWPGINTDARPTNLAQTIVGAGSAKA